MTRFLQFTLSISLEQLIKLLIQATKLTFFDSYTCIILASLYYHTHLGACVLILLVLFSYLNYTQMAGGCTLLLFLYTQLVDNT